jgi:hypothetical protein
VDEAVYCEPLSPVSSLLNREITGNFSVFGSFGDLYDTDKAAEMLGFFGNSLRKEQRIIFPDQGISKRYQGFFRPAERIFKPFIVDADSTR